MKHLSANNAHPSWRDSKELNPTVAAASLRKPDQRTIVNSTRPSVRGVSSHGEVVDAEKIQPVMVSRFERLAALAMGINARILRSGDGAFVVQYLGQRFHLRNLVEVAGWLTTVSPRMQGEIARASQRPMKSKGRL
jgi:hypothetical protein